MPLIARQFRAVVDQGFDQRVAGRPVPRHEANTSVDQVHILADNPSDNGPHALPRLSVNPQGAMLVRPWSGGRHLLYAPESTPHGKEEQKEVGGTGPGRRASRSGDISAARARRRGGAARRWADKLSGRGRQEVSAGSTAPGLQETETGGAEAALRTRIPLRRQSLSQKRPPTSVSRSRLRA